MQSFVKWIQKSGTACLLATATWAIAQTPAPDSSCPPPPLPLQERIAYINNAPAKNAGFLWRIDKNGRASWLYGTFHLNHIDYAKPGPRVMMSFRDSDVLAVELNLLEPQNPQASAPSTTANPPPGVAFSAGQLERLRAAYKRDCIAVDPSTVPPALATSSLLVSQAQRVGLFIGFSPDIRLVQIAKRNGKPVVALENMAQHIAALTPTTPTEATSSFESTMASFDSGATQLQLKQLHQAWQQNDWSAMVKLEQEMSASQPEFTNRILDERNVLMAQKIDAMHSEGKRVFVAVGSLHMAGKAALTQLMQDKGYTVTFVPLRN
jgi:uncharacterized protein YbaP (TraB family)